MVRLRFMPLVSRGINWVFMGVEGFINAKKKSLDFQQAIFCLSPIVNFHS